MMLSFILPLSTPTPTAIVITFCGFDKVMFIKLIDTDSETKNL